MSKHPRVDIETNAGQGKMGRCYVSTNFARRLEEELNEAMQRVSLLEDAMRPLIAMYKRHEEIIRSGRGSSQEDAYYCFYSGHHDEWDMAAKALEAKGNP